MQRNVPNIAKKEIYSFFDSATAILFVGTFLLSSLFMFFWVETFFARNISDIRPFFEWMPVLLIFLISALTMRLWSEEKRSGTIELILTKPVSSLSCVLGKFTACLGLVAFALLLTISLPLSVANIGNLDWGPVFGAYIACLILACSYISIGLAISSISENQIVSLICTTMVTGTLYIIGTEQFSGLFNNKIGDILRLISTGARFQAITRGMLDVADIYYYCSITATFLSLNVYFLERIRYKKNSSNKSSANWLIITSLLIANVLLGNIVMHKLPSMRFDLTQGKLYTLSKATKRYLSELKEPLTITGYFNDKTHPLLAPLIPELRDIIAEFEVAGAGKVRTKIVNPLDSEEIEEEIASQYGIKPIPLQMADKYQASLVNSYFNVVIKYGDQHEVLGFRDLIEVQSISEGKIDVLLRNPEYNITQKIKRVLQSFQADGNLFATIKQPITLTAYVSDDNLLPEELANFYKEIENSVQATQATSDGKLNFIRIKPDTQELQQDLANKFGFKPMQTSLFTTKQFYFYLVLSDSNENVQLQFSNELDKNSFTRSLNSGLKRFSTGFLKTVGIVNSNDSYQTYTNNKNHRMIQEKIATEHHVVNLTLDEGRVTDDVDILMVLAPEELANKQVFAIDQFLMNGGTVLLATSPFKVELDAGQIKAEEINSGITDWLTHHGIKLKQSLVLDSSSSSFPVPLNRKVGNLVVQDIRMIKYPYFVDIRVPNNSITGISQITMPWASPIEITPGLADKRVVSLLESSDNSWTTTNKELVPDQERYGDLGFAAPKEYAKSLLAVSLQGKFTSFYSDKISPLLESSEKNQDEAGADESTPTKLNYGSVIEKSPNSSKIILISSNEFLNDKTLSFLAANGTESYINSLDMVENMLDWSLEETDLLSIRNRGRFSKTLLPLSNEAQIAYEYFNYIAVLAGLAFACLLFRTNKKRIALRYGQMILQEI